MSSISNLTTTDAPRWDTAENHGPVVSVVSWLLIVATFLSVFARVATRWAVIHAIRSDDIAVMIALLFAVGQTIAVSLTVANGLGRPSDTLSASQLIAYQKNTYAADFLNIGALWLTKISLCLYLDTLTPVQSQKTIGIVIAAVTSLWAVSSIFVHAFQCQLPHAWEFLNAKCINLLAFWTYFDVMNIVTDIGLITLPFLILSGLQVDIKKKTVILACFASRLLTVAATILQIYFLHQAYDSESYSGGLTYTLYMPTLLTQIVLCLSLVTACIPYLKPFLEALETGMIRAGGAGNTRAYGSKGSKGYASKHSNNTTSSSGNHGSGGKLKGILGGRLSGLSGTQRSFGNGGAVKMESLANGGGVVGTEGTMRNSIRRGDSDRDSTGSQTGIITKTVDWELKDESSVRKDDGSYV